LEKQRCEESEKGEERGSEKRKSRKKEDAGFSKKSRKVAKHCVFPMICGSRGSKSRLAKAAGAEPAGQMRDEKSHAVVARSTFPSQNAENISTSEHFWKMQSGKSAHRCGAKHVSKSKCAKHQLRNNLRKCDVQKVHGVVARSAFGSENAKNTTWTLKLHFV